MIVDAGIDVRKALKSYFGFSEFRGPQEQVIQSILSGQDAFVVMPTGAGKSLCYQLPAVVMEGTAIVISPLIALMKNQVDHLRSLGIEAGYLNSSMTRSAYEATKASVRRGEMKVLYVAPETLVRKEFVDFAQEATISFVAIDEAHCISEWGHDFRPEYRKIRPTLNQIGPMPVLGLTATATPKVQLDIQHNLRIEDAHVYKTSFNRTNLYYEIRPKVKPAEQIVKFIKQKPGKSGIVYCLSRRKVEEIAELLKVNGIDAVPYHAGLDGETRSRHQEMFLTEETQVVVATIAFGMGIDKPDVRFVIHYDVPKSIESYYQETGRAGRDGQEGNCILFYSPSDITKLEKFLKDKPLSEREAGKHLLYEMAAFCEGGLCRRKHLLHYFGEQYEAERCGEMCDNCRHPRPTYDATQEVGMVLRTVQETGERYNMQYLISLIKGAGGDQLLALGHDKISTYGQGAALTEAHLKSTFTELLVRAYLEKQITDYGVVRLTEHGRQFLASPHRIELYEHRDYQKLEKQSKQHQPAAESKQVQYDEALYRKLMNKRAELAQQKGLPGYVIMLASSVEEIAQKYPLSVAEFQHIPGIGRGKAHRLAQPFLEVVQQHVQEHQIDRPDDVVVKTQARNSSDKLFIIQQIDRRTPLDEIAQMKRMSYEDVLNKVEQIIYAGSRLDIGYFIDQVLDPDRYDEIFDYFLQSETDSLEAAERELGGEFSREELQLVRASFYSQMAN
jgi:ATP-dependent DNA helicase RecQ